MKKIKLLIVICLSLVSAATAEVELNRLFTDNMVLQRNQKVPVWGIANPGVKITVEFAGQKKTTVTGTDGKWTLSLDPMKVSSAPRKMIVASGVSGVNFQISNILVGDVWATFAKENLFNSAGLPAWPFRTDAFPRPELLRQR